MKMFIERLQEIYDVNQPIFINEILDTFDEYSRSYVFKLIKKAEEKKEIMNFCQGVYYIPTKTLFGTSTITIDDVLNKKYVSDNNETFGIYSGLRLQNMFNLTTQMPNTIEIVTNKESMRKREIVIGGRKIILRKSKCDITNENVNEYTLLQLMTEAGDNIAEEVRKRLKKYIQENKVDYNKTLLLSTYFPSKTIKNLILSEVFDEFTQRD
jgi:predicted transcriptional regulator of viral defense system